MAKDFTSPPPHKPNKGTPQRVDLTLGDLAREELGRRSGKDHKEGQVAVALDASSNPASLPKIVASGRGALAEQILRLAFEHNIKVRQDADLAELLSTLDLDIDVPAEAVVAVADILARVFEANAALAKGTNTESQKGITYDTQGY